MGGTEYECTWVHSYSVPVLSTNVVKSIVLKYKYFSTNFLNVKCSNTVLKTTSYSGLTSISYTDIY